MLLFSEFGNSNAISIRGNSSALLQWRVEGIEVPSPNHFADVGPFVGGGLMSGLSSHVSGNSDFFVGAFPAEYSNAVAGVFDMKLRGGNISISYRINRRHTAHEFAIKTVNATGQKDYLGHKYNLKTGLIEPRLNKTSMFNVSYKVKF